MSTSEHSLPTASLSYRLTQYVTKRSYAASWDRSPRLNRRILQAHPRTFACPQAFPPLPIASQHEAPPHQHFADYCGGRSDPAPRRYDPVGPSSRNRDYEQGNTPPPPYSGNYSRQPHAHAPSGPSRYNSHVLVEHARFG
ncbi:hypothetical protein B0H17DRAFT_1215814 [Mycena rosella]|uniref:Uncharacterized protein n=1 Tax=Mycena rosella TaxID=1033263 RepID=A0AAD7CDC1_MYCRO|nr:hypothetical protein B0H17DRAFT_1215814 [Mycena rosella]